jgi:uncharacterized membrane protein YczE
MIYLRIWTLEGMVKSRKKTLIKVATQLVVGVVIGLSVGVMYYRPQSTLGGAAIYFIVTIPSQHVQTQKPEHSKNLKPP